MTERGTDWFPLFAFAVDWDDERSPRDQLRNITPEEIPDMLARGDAHVLLAAQVDGDWTAFAYVDVVDGFPTITEVRVVALPAMPASEWPEVVGHIAGSFSRATGFAPERPLTQRTLGRINLEAALREFGRLAGERHGEVAARMLGISRDALAAEPRRPGRKGHGDHWYAALADAYLKAVARNSPSPVEDVRAALNATLGTDYSRQYVANALQRARNMRILESAGPGKAGGQLTERGRRALEAG